MTERGCLALVWLGLIIAGLVFVVKAWRADSELEPPVDAVLGVGLLIVAMLLSGSYEGGERS